MIARRACSLRCITFLQPLASGRRAGRGWRRPLRSRSATDQPQPGRGNVGQGAALEIIREFTLHFALGETFPIDIGPFGNRSVGTVGEGWAHGGRINGTLVGPTADWALIG